MKSKLTKEDLERNGFILYQLENGFRYGTDSTLLSWFVASFIKPSKLSLKNPNKTHFNSKERDRNYNIMEFGSNVGASSMLLCARIKDLIGERTFDDIMLNFDAIELNTPSYEVLCQNIKENELESFFHPYNCDLRELPQEVKDKQYDIIFFNPPFFVAEDGPKTRVDVTNSNSRLNGRFEENGNLKDFLYNASKRIYPSKGRVIFVLNAERMVEAINLCYDCNLSPTHIMMIHPFEDRSANLFLMSCKLSAKKSKINILPPLILNKIADGEIVTTDVLNKIYNGEHKNCFI